MRDLSFIKHDSERRFAETFFDHDEWEYQPGPYFLSTGSKYTPDFLDKKRNVLIEVVGTRQAYAANRFKYEFFKSHHDLELEFRLSSGEIMEVYTCFQRYESTHTFTDDRFNPGDSFLALPTMAQIRNEIFHFISSTRMSVKKLSNMTGVPQSTLSRFLSDSNKSSLSYNNVELLWPVLYGDQSGHPAPTPAP